jgi:tripartite-type tricarboxylate transporter receptor subunit TctC
MRRSIFIVSLFTIVCAISIGVPTLQAQPYPSHPIQLIIPSAPGDGTDIAARLFAEELTKILKVPVVPFNKPGASATLGTDMVVKSKKDGYTILYANTSAVVYAKASEPETVPYDPVKDLEPLGFHTFFPTVTCLRTDAPWKDFSEFIDYAKKNPGKINYGTMGVSTIDSVQWEMVKAIVSVNMTMIPFKGVGAKTTALLGGHVEAASFPLAVFETQYRSGKVRGILLDQSVPDFPDIPTLQQLGYKRGIPSPWTALFAPIGITEEAKKVLIPAIETAIKNPDLMSRMQKMWYIPGYKPPAELKNLLVDDYENARDTFKKSVTTK